MPAFKTLPLPLGTLFACSLPLLLGGCEQHYDTIEAIPFVDQNFRACVLETGDTYPDDITELDCGGRNIRSAAEVKYFENLRELSLEDNHLESLDLSDTPDLRHLNLSDNQLNGLDLSENHELREVRLSHNEIST